MSKKIFSNSKLKMPFLTSDEEKFKYVPPKTHPDCAYCGTGGDGYHICGVCKEAGIDGPVIKGTEAKKIKVNDAKGDAEKQKMDAIGRALYFAKAEGNEAEIKRLEEEYQKAGEEFRIATGIWSPGFDSKTKDKVWNVGDTVYILASDINTGLRRGEKGVVVKAGDKFCDVRTNQGVDTIPNEFLGTSKPTGPDNTAPDMDSKTRDKAPKHPRYRIKDDKVFRLRDSLKKLSLKAKDVYSKGSVDKKANDGKKEEGVPVWPPVIVERDLKKIQKEMLRAAEKEEDRQRYNSLYRGNRPKKTNDAFGNYKGYKYQNEAGTMILYNSTGQVVYKAKASVDDRVNESAMKTLVDHIVDKDSVYKSLMESRTIRNVDSKTKDDNPPNYQKAGGAHEEDCGHCKYRNIGKRYCAKYKTYVNLLYSCDSWVGNYSGQGHGYKNWWADSKDKESSPTDIECPKCGASVGSDYKETPYGISFVCPKCGQQYIKYKSSKDSDHRGYKVKDQIIKGFLIYKSGKGPATFFAKNENGKEFEGTMEQIKKQIDDYWVKQDEDVMKQKVRDGESKKELEEYIKMLEWDLASEDDPEEIKNYKDKIEKAKQKLKTADSKTKDAGNPTLLIAKRSGWIGDFGYLPNMVIYLSLTPDGRVAVNSGAPSTKYGTNIPMSRIKQAIEKGDMEIGHRGEVTLDAKVKDASQAYLDGYAAARGAYGKHTNPIKDDPAKAAEWDKGWEDGKADKDELSAKGSGQEFVKHGSHFKDAKPKHPRWHIAGMKTGDKKTKDINLLPEEIERIVMEKAGVSKSVAQRAVSKLLEQGEISAAESDASIINKARKYLPTKDNEPNQSDIEAAQRGNNMVGMSLVDLDDLIRLMEGKSDFAARVTVAAAKQMIAAKKRMGAKDSTRKVIHHLIKTKQRKVI